MAKQKILEIDEKPDDEQYMSFDDSVVGYSTAATAVLNDPIKRQINSAVRNNKRPTPAPAASAPK
jgi:hypothetical protein